eukprot:COSAG01_NODE_6189_length_3803_cov_5.416847_5_plen_128_part_01
MRQLCRELHTREPFSDVPPGVDSSQPFFLEILPDLGEKLLYGVWPGYLVFSVGFYYTDLFLDLAVVLQYYARGTGQSINFAGIQIDEHGDNDDASRMQAMKHFWYACSFFAGAIFITCLFDLLTTFHP